MLVLSRKASEEIIFPALGVTIRVLRTAANTVKLGVEAPSHLKVLRGEISSCDALLDTVDSLAQGVETHALRNRLNGLVLKLELIKRAEQNGLSSEHLPMIEELTRSLAKLDSTLGLIATPASAVELGNRKLRMLVVDDDANERELLMAVLNLQGFDAQGVGDGVDAIERLNNNVPALPDAVLMDLEMPRLGGEPTLRCIRSDPRFKNLKVIAISGRRPQHDHLPDRLRGFDAWFAKPLQLQQLLEVVSRP